MASSAASVNLMDRAPSRDVEAWWSSRYPAGRAGRRKPPRFETRSALPGGAELGSLCERHLSGGHLKLDPALDGPLVMTK